MNIYILGIIIFVIILIIAIFLLIYFIKDENKLAEVTTKELINYGKKYTKQEFEDRLFNQYKNILENIQYENYSFLRDAVADDIYNQILLNVKQNREQSYIDVISDINKEFSKLISFNIINDIEVAKLWIKYRSIEYTKVLKKTYDENNNEIITEEIVKGTKEPKTNEYIITFIKNKTESEDITCPNCGFETDILISNKCIKCDQEVVPKKMHWVYLDKELVNIK